MHPLERLVNLVALLLESRTPLTFDQIRGKLAEGYGHQDASSAKRMFERDKDVLRDIGVPIEVVSTDAWDVEHGYTIDKQRYYLPDIAFTPEELSALFVAVRSAGDVSAEDAVRKLLSGAERGILAGLGPPGARRRDRPEPVRVPPKRSPRDGACASPTEPRAASDRTGPWTRSGSPSAAATGTSSASIATEGRSDRSASHGSRATSRSWGRGPTLPRASARPSTSGRDRGVPARPETTATVAFAPDVAWWATKGVAGAEVMRTREDGWVEVSVAWSPGERLVSWILSFGPDAEVVEPPELRSELIGRLEAILAS